MIKPVYEMSEAEVWKELERAQAVHIASTQPDGAPLLRTLHGVVVDGSVCFHGGDHGDKLAAVGTRVVLSWERIVARIPSYFVDPERACPASTYYVSGQAQGVLERVTGIQDKARVLSALMERFQAEGGYAPIEAADPRYRKAVESILILRVRPETLTGKRKLGQNRPTQQIERILRGLWKRGADGDLAAFELVRRSHPGNPVPAFLRGPGDTTLCVQPGEADLAAARALVADAYWNTDTDADTTMGAHRGSAAWVGARSPTGRLVATARAISDGRKHATIYDVAVHATHRGQGIGSAVLDLILDHPAIRNCTKVGLITKDAQAFYGKFGFAAAPPRYTTMQRARNLPLKGTTARV